ncbi:hypothetical protein [Sinorhizobium meliloti]|uniref:hypothetical protein n=1 Tax=Rhizobium meliloti TaxID=382 RepID=UPI000FDA7EF2|nr:hypothetical protein [Sinorhizobium meliloti]RVM20227.1 hypothetical protein CN142_00080 [Sinorhizobium meliloti]
MKAGAERKAGGALDFTAAWCMKMAFFSRDVSSLQGMRSSPAAGSGDPHRAEPGQPASSLGSMDISVKIRPFLV